MLTYQNENIGESYAFRSRYHHPGYSVPPHIHEYSEILYVSDGCMTMYLDGERRCVDAGCAVFVFPNQSHEYTSETPCESWCAVFSNDYLHTFYRLYADRIPTLPIVELSAEGAGMIERLQKTDKDDSVAVAGLLHLLFSELAHNSGFEQRQGIGNELYNRAINYISANFRVDFSLADMAKALGYHEKYLSSELHFLTKMNFRAFLSTYRIDHAKRLLRTTGKSIAEIALDSGYSSINTFNRAFKNAEGSTPSEYRKRRS